MEEEIKKLNKIHVLPKDEEKEVLAKEDKERIAFLMHEYRETFRKLYEYDKNH